MSCRLVGLNNHFGQTIVIDMKSWWSCHVMLTRARFKFGQRSWWNDLGSLRKEGLTTTSWWTSVVTANRAEYRQELESRGKVLAKEECLYKAWMGTGKATGPRCELSPNWAHFSKKKIFGMRIVVSQRLSINLRMPFRWNARRSEWHLLELEGLRWTKEYSLAKAKVLGERSRIRIDV